jgi:hypothetical protein
MGHTIAMATQADAMHAIAQRWRLRRMRRGSNRHAARFLSFR